MNAWNRPLAPFVLVALMIASPLVGCAWVGGSRGSIRAQSLGDDPVLLQGNFRNVYFAYDPNGEPSFMLSDVPLNQVASGEARTAQVLHVQLLWLPAAGRTPMESSATNASIRYVVIADGEVGVYSGAGFAMYSGNLASKKVTVTLRDATLQLQDSTTAFNDLLSPAHLTGTFTATRYDAQARQMRRAASQIVTSALGRTRLVLAGS